MPTVAAPVSSVSSSAGGAVSTEEPSRRRGKRQRLNRDEDTEYQPEKRAAGADEEEDPNAMDAEAPTTNFAVSGEVPSVSTRSSVQRGYRRPAAVRQQQNTGLSQEILDLFFLDDQGRFRQRANINAVSKIRTARGVRYRPTKLISWLSYESRPQAHTEFPVDDYEIIESDVDDDAVVLSSDDDEYMDQPFFEAIAMRSSSGEDDSALAAIAAAAAAVSKPSTRSAMATAAQVALQSAVAAAVSEHENSVNAATALEAGGDAGNSSAAAPAIDEVICDPSTTSTITSQESLVASPAIPEDEPMPASEGDSMEDDSHEFLISVLDDHQPVVQCDTLEQYDQWLLSLKQRTFEVDARGLWTLFIRRDIREISHLFFSVFFFLLQLTHTKQQCIAISAMITAQLSQSWSIGDIRCAAISFNYCP